MVAAVWRKTRRRSSPAAVGRMPTAGLAASSGQPAALPAPPPAQQPAGRPRTAPEAQRGPARRALAGPIRDVERRQQGHRVPAAQLRRVHVLRQHPREDAEGDGVDERVGQRQPPDAAQHGGARQPRAAERRPCCPCCCRCRAAGERHAIQASSAAARLQPGAAVAGMLLPGAQQSLCCHVGLLAPAVAVAEVLRRALAARELELSALRPPRRVLLLPRGLPRRLLHRSAALAHALAEVQRRVQRCAAVPLRRRQARQDEAVHRGAAAADQGRHRKVDVGGAAQAFLRARQRGLGEHPQQRDRHPCGRAGQRSNGWVGGRVRRAGC